jgi:hypothetical protein
MLNRSSPVGTPLRAAMASRNLLAAAGMGACVVAAWWPMPEVRLVSEAAAAVPLTPAPMPAEATTVLPSPSEPARRLTEETQAQPAEDLPLKQDLPLKEERHPPPIVNYLPPKPKHVVDDKSGKSKSDTKSKAKKPVSHKTKAVHTKRKTG